MTAVKRRPKVKLWTIISRAVEEGAAYGIRRAYKHTDTPTHEDICEQVEREVMNALAEVLDFGITFEDEA